jgi:DNA polymerase-3 subunit beta
MKIKTKTLGDALDRLAPIVGRRTTLPILSCVKFEAIDSRLYLTADSMDQRQVEIIECEGEFAAICVGFERLRHAIGGEDLEITMSGEKMQIQFSLGGTKIAVLPAEDFPDEKKDKWIASGINCEELADSISRTQWACSKDLSRYMLNGVHICGSSKKLVCEATTGRELAVLEKAIICSDIEAVIPATFCSQLIAALSRKDSGVSFGKNAIKVSHAEGAFYCQLLDGVYPNTQNVMPKKTNLIGEIQTGPLIDALSRINFLGGQTEAHCLLSFSTSGLGVQFVGKEDEASFRIDGNFKEHDAAMNATTLLGCIKALGSESAKVFKPSKDDVDNLLIFQSGDLFVYTAKVRTK